jgi:hypothetical protein
LDLPEQVKLTLLWLLLSMRLSVKKFAESCLPAQR